MVLPQGWELVLLVLLALLIFGGTRLAGAGKNAGRAIREFKDETRQIKADEQRARKSPDGTVVPPAVPGAQPGVGDDVLDAELVDPPLREKPDTQA